MRPEMPSALQMNSYAGTTDGFVVEPALAQPVSGTVRQPIGSVGGLSKRALDVMLAGTALLILLPLMLCVALMIKLTSQGPVLFGHERVGFAGQRFRCWKFRTMVVDGERVLAEHFVRFPGERSVWLAERKLCNDPRVTPLGAVLRKLSVDELPQLFNILMGHMSLVGPRPVVAEELENYRDSADYYLRTRPGLTGLWQVSGRNDASYRKRVMLDRLYVCRWSMLLDLQIILRTVPAVLTSRGAR
jgi:exopolysaccharide production protein ExoY